MNRTITPSLSSLSLDAPRIHLLCNDTITPTLIIMNLLKELNLTPVKKTTGRNPIVLRRESLIKGIDKQLSICESLLTDNEFARDHQTGRKIPSWFWLEDSGNYYLSINYGKQPMELSRGKFSIVCDSIENVKTSLSLVRESVQMGDFDKQLEKRSKVIRSNFK